jgi:hypothetical protein
VEFSEEEKTEEFWSVVSVTLPEPVSPETVTVNGSPCITLPESAPNCETETVRVAEACESKRKNEIIAIPKAYFELEGAEAPSFFFVIFIPP